MDGQENAAYFSYPYDFTLEQMSKVIVVRHSTLSKIENGHGKPNARTVYKIYKAYPEFGRICPDYQQVMGLADDEPEMSPKVQKQRKKSELPLFTGI